MSGHSAVQHLTIVRAWLLSACARRAVFCLSGPRAATWVRWPEQRCSLGFGKYDLLSNKSGSSSVSDNGSRQARSRSGTRQISMVPCSPRLKAITVFAPLESMACCCCCSMCMRWYAAEQRSCHEVRVDYTVVWEGQSNESTRDCCREAQHTTQHLLSTAFQAPPKRLPQHSPPTS